MKIAISIILLLISNAVLAGLPESVIAQHKNGASYQLSDEDTQFTFIGSFDSISNESYMTPHGESWSISLSIEKMLMGSHDKRAVQIGTHDRNDSTFKLNTKYYITIDWGRHGMMLMGYQEVE
ncbi:hypothetical protein [Aliikangiella sp. IMCC44359]|uniref:hypothetical protein n=1 Tax=Aliikangiella sp. IMCC44359 TaxID=3459125 RepID=UPI00403ABD2B